MEHKKCISGVTGDILIYLYIVLCFNQFKHYLLKPLSCLIMKTFKIRFLVYVLSGEADPAR